MRRRELSSALLIAATGGAVTPSRATCQTATTVVGNSRTPAEIRAGVQPTAVQYAESDIRRYGALIAKADNSAAVNEALAVSAHGGNPAFIPPGVWSIEKTLTVTGVASLFGAGNSSIIAAHACDGIWLTNGGNYAVTGTARFMRDFQLIGHDAKSSSYRGIRVDGSVASGQWVTGVDFCNLHIANFATAVHLRGLYDSHFESCFLYNNYRGFHFYGQTITTSITHCTVQRGDIAGQGGSWGIAFQTVDGESTQNTHIAGSNIYGYDIDINVELAFELQIEHCDISAAQSIGIQITSTIGGLWVRDCWIETTKQAMTTGVLVNDITPTTHTKVSITGNYINCDHPYPGSQGIRVGNSNSAILINENQVYGFDHGITLGASTQVVCKFNTIDINSTAFSASSHSILLNSLATDSEIGPNYIVPGDRRPAIADSAHGIMMQSAQSAFPVGTPIQFDVDALGFFAGVTYFVSSLSGSVITLAAAPGGVPILVTGRGDTGQLFAAPLPLAFTAGTPAGISFYGRGSFVMTLSGHAAAVSGAINWVASGKLVGLCAASGVDLTGRSTGTEMGGVGLPAFLRPRTTQLFCASLINDGKPTSGMASLSNAGTLIFHASAGHGTFSASGQKGLDNVAMTFFYT